MEIASLQEQQDGLVEQHDSEGSAKHGEEIAQGSHPQGVAEGKEHEAMGDKLIERCSWGVTHLEAVAGGDELAAVPPTDRPVHG